MTEGFECSRLKLSVVLPVVRYSVTKIINVFTILVVRQWSLAIVSCVFCMEGFVCLGLKLSVVLPVVCYSVAKIINVFIIFVCSTIMISRARVMCV